MTRLVSQRRRSFPRSVIVAALAATVMVTSACSSDDDDDAQSPTTESQVAEDSGGDAPVDPLPDVDEPGLVTCDGCPKTDDFTDFEPDFGKASSQLFQGTVTGAKDNGTFYVEGADGQAFGGSIETGAQDGKYSVTVPLLCGDQTVKLVWENDRGRAGAVLRPKTTGCTATDIRVTLSWDDAGFDFELHLIREGGTINDGVNDCTWTSCIGGGLDWGRTGDTTDDPAKDVDDTGTFGPENIVYPEPEDGLYTVMVEHWGSGASGATGTVVVNVAGKKPVAIAIDGLDPKHVVTVATIEWPSGTITPIGTVHDCSANWSGGCLDKIPA
jgi:hypothetical protein